jgi:beta-galactosidase GanA
MSLGVTAFAQEVHFDYDRLANFSAYKTYQWVDYKAVQVGNELLDRDIKRAVDEQLAGKGLRRVESGGDLVVGCQAGISQEKEFDNIGAGGWGGPFGWGNWGNGRVTTSTIDIGKLTIGLFDPASRQLVWRGAASKTLSISKDPDKNYRNLQKA